MNEPLTGLLTTDEVAQAVGVSVATVRRWVASGAFRPHSMMGTRPLYLAGHVSTFLTSRGRH